MLKNIKSKVLLSICLGVSSFFCTTPVRAAVIKYDFNIKFYKSYSYHPLSETTASGYFTYDDLSIIITTRGYSYAPISDLSLNFPSNILLTEEDDANKISAARFYNGNFIGIDYLVSKPSLAITIDARNPIYTVGSVQDMAVSASVVEESYASRHFDFNSPYYFNTSMVGNILFGSITYNLFVPFVPPAPDSVGSPFPTTQIPEPLTTGGTIVAGMLGFALARKSKIKTTNLG